ncbi:DUF685 domain-containing protein [Borrelia miyamotoi]|uniref:DUF685 domain-containing protein n=1 Tax=Borrelia miyamotoi TaxID=47466 RepID=A0AAQ3AGD6_9SPIR|nr:DUF685 domain-containing protein [Borrelia miyamotoi]WAZ85602.1 DUF685 domain-containing protein [Borrelia miyamotoi]WAZ91386.1 DUF685 domain-containing protein [Borrelia miyamotoi]WAZ92672.1 DUF685 domain-containing protein [Borrelia miyamotoi]WAZ93963.1 DUF685 domain-containing protein [Borrelia miyamotoi]WAZ95254.1 DUF685 domain-containing protein [Borrelia miyamotoi]
MVLDNGFSSYNAITLDNFLKDFNKKTFEDKGPEYFKGIIQKTIATELLTNTNFIDQVYAKIMEILKKNHSSAMDAIISQVTNKFENNLSQDSF